MKATLKGRVPGVYWLRFELPNPGQVISSFCFIGFLVMSNPVQTPPLLMRLSALDGLRGYAAFMVVFFHSILEIKPTLMDEVLRKPVYALNSVYDFWVKIFLILFNGQAAVVLFFVLSGAVLMRSLLNTDPSRLSFPRLLFKFSTQRVFRIYPALFVSLVGVYCLSNTLSEVFPSIFHEHFSITQFWQNTFLVSNQLHGASWTLQVEMMAVPFVCLTFFLLKSKGRVLFPMFLMLTLLYGAVFARHYPIGLISFLLGFLLTAPKIRDFFSWLHPRFFIVFLALTLSIKHLFPGGEIQAVKAILWGLQGISAFALVGFVCHNHRGLFIRCLKHPFSQFLGRISYSLYLLNVVGLHALIKLMQHCFPQWCVQDPLSAGLFVGVVLSLITLPMAYVSYEYIEKNGIKWGRRLSRPSQITVRGLVPRAFKG